MVASVTTDENRRKWTEAREAIHRRMHQLGIAH